MRRATTAGDQGVTAVLGAILMLALMMTLIPGALMLRAAVSEEMEAHRAAAEQAAWCARRPEIGPPDCPDRGPMPGYLCREVELEVWVCGRGQEEALAPNLTAGVPTLPASPTPRTAGAPLLSTAAGLG